MSGERRGITTGTPVPRTDRERSNGAGPVITYQLSPEELALELERFRNMRNPKKRQPRLYAFDQKKVEAEPMKRTNVAKEDFIRVRAQGLGRGRAGKELGLGPVELHWHLKEWGIENRDNEQQAIEAWKTEHPDIVATAPEVAPSSSPSEALTSRKKVFDEERKSVYLQHRANGLTRSEAFTQMHIPAGSIAHGLKQWGLSDKEVEAVEIAKLQPQTETPAGIQSSAGIPGVDTSTVVYKPVETGPTAPSPKQDSVQHANDTKPVTREVTITIPLDENVLQSAFSTIMGDVYENALAHGWHEDTPPLPVLLALIHSEVSEALEADRKHLGEDAVAEELADVIIRVMDTAASQRLDLAGALFRKMAKNRDREFRHGGRKY